MLGCGAKFEVKGRGDDHVPSRATGPSMTRILVNGLSARLGGGQTYLRNLLLHAPSDGSVDVMLLCQDSLNLASVPGSVVRHPTPAALVNPFRGALWEEKVLPGLVAANKIDLVFSPAACCRDLFGREACCRVSEHAAVSMPCKAGSTA